MPFFPLGSDADKTSIPDLVDTVSQMNFGAPDVICLCIKGNQHNTLGLFEGPTLISIGGVKAGDKGVNGPSRAFIPFHVMVDRLYHNFDPRLF
jgi:hypothetical protein